MKGFVRRLVFKQRHKATTAREWPIETVVEIAKLLFVIVRKQSIYPRSRVVQSFSRWSTHKRPELKSMEKELVVSHDLKWFNKNYHHSFILLQWKTWKTYISSEVQNHFTCTKVSFDGFKHHHVFIENAVTIGSLIEKI